MNADTMARFSRVMNPPSFERNPPPIIPAVINYHDAKPSWVPKNVHAGVFHDKTNHRICKLIKDIGYCVIEFPETQQ